MISINLSLQLQRQVAIEKIVFSVKCKNELGVDQWRCLNFFLSLTKLDFSISIYTWLRGCNSPAGFTTLMRGLQSVPLRRLPDAIYSSSSERITMTFLTKQFRLWRTIIKCENVLLRTFLHFSLEVYYMDFLLLLKREIGLIIE